MDTDKIKVSVVIPTFNEEGRIRECLELIMKQDYPNYEIIVVDNNCTDKTAEIASSMDIKVVSEKNRGTTWARERGRKESSGEIIVTMDADCRPESDWLTKGVKYFADRNVVVASGPYDYYDLSRGFRWFSLFFQKTVYVVVHQLLQVSRVGGVTLGGNTFIRASALKQAGGFNTKLTFYGDDTDLPKRLSKYGRCVFGRCLVIKSSGRRFKREGILRLQTKYIYHFLKVIFTASS